MKKIILGAALSLFILAGASAGDVATFVDKGFTENGRYYVFGQYGKTDVKFQGYAELYQVDVELNDYVSAGVFSTKPGAVTANKNGKDVFEDLEAKSFSYYRNVKTEPAQIDQVLYILDDVNKSGTDEIVFTDFKNSDIEKPDTYKIQLCPEISGYGKNVKSSFFIMVEKVNSEGTVIFRRKVGSPDITRKGVKNYKIERIFCDKSGTSFIFVIEKTIEDDTGTSIRYMVEAAKF